MLNDLYTRVCKICGFSFYMHEHDENEEKLDFVFIDGLGLIPCESVHEKDDD